MGVCHDRISEIIIQGDADCSWQSREFDDNHSGVITIELMSDRLRLGNNLRKTLAEKVINTYVNTEGYNLRLSVANFGNLSKPNYQPILSMTIWDLTEKKFIETLEVYKQALAKLNLCINLLDKEDEAKKREKEKQRKKEINDKIEQIKKQLDLDF